MPTLWHGAISLTSSVLGKPSGPNYVRVDMGAPNTQLELDDQRAMVGEPIDMIPLMVVPRRKRE